MPSTGQAGRCAGPKVRHDASERLGFSASKSDALTEQRAQLRAEIAELEAQLVPLRAELQRLQTLLDRCYLRQSVIPDRGAVLVNA